MRDPIVTIETAIVNRLVILNKEAWANKCKYIDSYGGQFDTPEELPQAAQKAPGLWVTYEGETGELQNGVHYARINYVVFCLARSFAPQELRKGGPQVVGLYQLIEAVRLALVNQTLGTDMKPLELVGVTPLWRGGPQGGGFSLAAMRLTTQVAIEIEPALDLDEIICPAPLYVTEWRVPGLPKTIDQR